MALATGAGVHLPAAGLPAHEARALLGSSALIGTSCHSATEVLSARDGGADFAVLGPIWPTPSKTAYGAPLGLEALRAARDAGLPIFAVGGVDEFNAAEALDAGAHGVACIRAVWSASDPGAAVARLWSQLSGARV